MTTDTKTDLATGAGLSMWGSFHITLAVFEETMRTVNLVLSAVSLLVGLGFVVYKWKTAIKHNKRRNRREDDVEETNPVDIPSHNSGGVPND